MGPKEVTGLEVFNLLTKNLHNHPVGWVLLFPPYGWGRIRGSGVKQLPKTVIKYQGWDLNLDSQPSFYQPCTQLWYHAMSKRSRDQKNWGSSLSCYKRTSKNLLSLCFLLHLWGSNSYIIPSGWAWESTSMSPRDFLWDLAWPKTSLLLSLYLSPKWSLGSSEKRT